MNQPTPQELLLHDSETLKHINAVQKNMSVLVSRLVERAQAHDNSKFEEPERSVFALNTPKLAQVEYGSKEYGELLNEVKVATDNHYAKNTHHPEHWPNGIEDMDLLDLIEMLSDWAAATSRNKNGNVHRSIEYNKTRFGISDQLAQIFKNTVNRYF